MFLLYSLGTHALSLSLSLIYIALVLRPVAVRISLALYPLLCCWSYLCCPVADLISLVLLRYLYPFPVTDLLSVVPLLAVLISAVMLQLSSQLSYCSCYLIFPVAVLYVPCCFTVISCRGTHLCCPVAVRISGCSSLLFCCCSLLPLFFCCFYHGLQLLSLLCCCCSYLVIQFQSVLQLSCCLYFLLWFLCQLFSCSLGAQHDGENNSCSSADRYAMSLGGVHNISESNKLHPWRFSNCSLDYFRKSVQDLVDGV